jgi:hypothetical protein
MMAEKRAGRFIRGPERSVNANGADLRDLPSWEPRGPARKVTQTAFADRARRPKGRPGSSFSVLAGAPPPVAKSDRQRHFHCESRAALRRAGRGLCREHVAQVSGVIARCHAGGATGARPDLGGSAGVEQYIGHFRPRRQRRLRLRHGAPSLSELPSPAGAWRGGAGIPIPLLPALRRRFAEVTRPQRHGCTAASGMPIRTRPMRGVAELMGPGVAGDARRCY